MANTIALAELYMNILDEVYKASAKTAILDAPEGVVRAGMTADTIYLKNIALQGLGDYSRNAGFVAGDVTVSWQSHTIANDRGRSFSVDEMDNVETLEDTFTQVVSEFIRTQVIPEVDAIRISTMAGLAGNSATPATLTASTVDSAIQLGEITMDEAEVPEENRVLFVTPTVESLIRSSDNYVRNLDAINGGGIDNRFNSYDGMEIVKIPQNRMYTVIDLYDGSTSGQEAGGYIKNATTGKNINFLIVHKGAVLGIVKHAKPRIFTPDQNINADAYKLDYRIYHDLFVPDNKTDGIYLHAKA